jgi:cytidine deaminase
MFSGACLENAAFNPSLSPLQAAPSSLILAGRDFSGIAEACLVEVGTAPISQTGATQAVLGAIAPAARLRRVVATVRA